MPTKQVGASTACGHFSRRRRVVLFGVNKDADTLKLILDPETFAGIVISDDAAVYEYFTKARKMLGAFAA